MDRPFLDTLYLAWSLYPTDETLTDLLTGIRLRARRSGYEFRDAADDFAQNVCMTVWQNLSSFKQKMTDSFTRWVLVITKNEKLKRYSGKRHISSEQMAEQAVDDHDFIDVADLPTEIKEVAVSLLRGYSIKETAERMNLKPASLRKKLQRFRHKTPSLSA